MTCSIRLEAIVTGEDISAFDNPEPNAIAILVPTDFHLALMFKVKLPNSHT
jgi:hypothetical protein